MIRKTDRSISMIAACGAATGFSPTTNATYIFAIPLTVNPGTSTTANVRLAEACTWRWANFLAAILGTPGSTENVAIYLRNETTATDYALSTSVAWNASIVETRLENQNVSFAKDDKVSFKVMTPATWATKPTVMFLQAQAHFDIP